MWTHKVSFLSAAAAAAWGEFVPGSKMGPDILCALPTSSKLAPGYLPLPGERARTTEREWLAGWHTGTQTHCSIKSFTENDHDSISKTIESQDHPCVQNAWK